MQQELTEMMETVAWKELQRVIEDNCKNVMQILAAHTRMGRKKQGLVKTLEDATKKPSAGCGCSPWLCRTCTPPATTHPSTSRWRATGGGRPYGTSKLCLLLLALGHDYWAADFEKMDQSRVSRPFFVFDTFEMFWFSALLVNHMMGVVVVVVVVVATRSRSN